MSITINREPETTPTKNLTIESSLPNLSPNREPFTLLVGQFYKGLPPAMGGGEPEPVGLFIDVADTEHRQTENIATMHLSREDVKALHQQFGDWLEGKWEVDRPQLADLDDLAKSLLGGVK